jgi:hypothetical protein
MSKPAGKLTGKLKFAYETIENLQRRVYQQQAEIEQLKKLVIKPEVLKFLHGSGKLEGNYFTDNKYWWRKYLPKAPEGKS